MDCVVVIPAYNEEKNIKKAVERTIKAGYVALVIDDHSSDNTYNLAKAAGAIVIRHEKNKGKGRALATAFNYILNNIPDAKFIAILDADLQYIPEDLYKIFNPLIGDEADYVTGCRNWKTVPFRHRLGNFVWRTAFNILFGTRLKDSNCGFIAMNRDAMKKLIKSTEGGYIIENMMMITALKNNLRIKQVPVRVFYYQVRDIPTGTRFVSGNLIYIIESGLKYRFNVDLKLYEKLERLKLIFTKGSD